MNGEDINNDKFDTRLAMDEKDEGGSHQSHVGSYNCLSVDL